MPITISTYCSACGGLGQTWDPGKALRDCDACGGTGKTSVLVRTVYDSLADHCSRRVVAQADAHTSPDTPASDRHACLWCDPNAHPDTIHAPCPEHSSGASPDARNGVDHDRRSGGRPAETHGPDISDQGAGPDAASVRDQDRRPVHRVAGAAMSRRTALLNSLDGPMADATEVESWLHRPAGEGLIGYCDAMNRGLERWR